MPQLMGSPETKFGQIRMKLADMVRSRFHAYTYSVSVVDFVFVKFKKCNQNVLLSQYKIRY